MKQKLGTNTLSRQPGDKELGTRSLGSQRDPKPSGVGRDPTRPRPWGPRAGVSVGVSGPHGNVTGSPPWTRTLGFPPRSEQPARPGWGPLSSQPGQSAGSRAGGWAKARPPLRPWGARVRCGVCPRGRSAVCEAATLGPPTQPPSTRPAWLPPGSPPTLSSSIHIYIYIYRI